LSQPTADQLRDYQRDGFFLARGLLPAEACDDLRRLIEAALAQAEELAGRFLFDQEKAVRAGGGAEWAARDRYRKLGQIAQNTPEYWERFIVHPRMLAVARYFLGDEIRLMYDSVFLKPARHGDATPWHQDIGLWPNKLHQALSIWVALDPATRENGCLQMLPGSHRGGVIEHVTYPDSLHKELPRELVADLAPAHVELAPGDAVVWHAGTWHHSPPNRSEQNRIGVAAVYVTAADAASAPHPGKMRWPWVLRDGMPCAFTEHAATVESY